jgi:hypothetical protein
MGHDTCDRGLSVVYPRCLECHKQEAERALVRCVHRRPARAAAQTQLTKRGRSRTLQASERTQYTMCVRMAAVPPTLCGLHTQRTESRRGPRQSQLEQRPGCPAGGH